MKPVFFEFGKKTMFFQFFKNLLNSIDLALDLIFDVKQNII